MRRLVFCFGIIVVLAASCSMREKEYALTHRDDEVFYASFEQPDEGTKVYANEDLYLRWTADDRVSIFNKNTYNQQYQFTGETGANAGGFRKVASEDEFLTGNSISHVISVYPYQESTVISEKEALSLTLPTKQQYSENTFGLGANTMVSVSTNNVLQYKNVGGYLRISLYGEGVSVSMVSLRGNNNEVLAGSAIVTMPLEGVPSVSMGYGMSSEIYLVCDTPVVLGATEEESKDFWFVVPPVTFSQGFTISVIEDTGGIYRKSTSKSIAIERSKVSKMSPIEVEVVSSDNPVPEAIDLGLSVKWASFNLGASRPEEFGDYYAWGETDPYYELGYARSQSPEWKPGKEAGYTWLSYMWYKEPGLTKYCWDSSAGYNGCTDTKTVLNPEDDAAHMGLGGNWRMPTSDELAELQSRCSLKWTTLNGIYGIEITGPNGNKVFFPAAGMREGRDLFDIGGAYYWSSSLYMDDPNCALLSLCNYYAGNQPYYRFIGATVRPVFVEYAPVASISLNKSSIEVGIGKERTLHAAVLPENANMSVSWSSSDESIVSVSSTGVVTGEAVGSAVITATSIDGSKTAICEVTVKESAISVPDAVDLGLSVKWASFNLGASEPEEFGDYYAWGETEPYYTRQHPLNWKEDKIDGYSWASYKWYLERGFTKYCWDSSNGYHGFTDAKTVLDQVDDAASAALGGGWRMPTVYELTELIENCVWEWTVMNGINGQKITGPNGNSIFLPAAGGYETNELFCAGSFAQYWSSSLSKDWTDQAMQLIFDFGLFPDKFDNIRYSGSPIRPVIPTVVEGVLLNQTSVDLGLGGKVLLEATILPENATVKTVSWSSSDESVATVSSAGIVKGMSMGTAVISVTTNDGGKSASCYVTVNDSTIPEAIDLGLSVKWASFNLGASEPEEHGDYFAWGDLEPYYDYQNPLIWKEGKEGGYDWSSYIWCGGAYSTITKYCSISSYGYQGFTDDQTVLNPEDDAAFMFLGEKWRMPTSTELMELIDRCTWEWTSKNGIYGHQVTGPNGNSIFLPASGVYWSNELYDDDCGRYWSSSLLLDDSQSAYSLSFYSGGSYNEGIDRVAGMPIRPVYGDIIPVESVSLRSSLEIGVGLTWTLSATVFPDNASDKIISWSSSDESIVTVSSSGVVKGVSIGSAEITVISNNGGRTATCHVLVSEATVPVPDAVDLGLSVKWASFNLGASEPEGYGDYYAWGEIEPYYSRLRPLTWKEDKSGGYDWPSYKWCLDAGDTMTKYCSISSYGNDGFTDTKTVLDPEDDAAYIALCGKWRMPTKEELDELRTQCSWAWTSLNGIYGRTVTGPNGNSIFLPAGGRYVGKSNSQQGAVGYYWSSSLCTSNPLNAYMTYLNSSYMYGSNSSRYEGCTIRPVTE